MGSNAPTWADQWGFSDSFGGERDDKFDSKKSGGKKMYKVKAAASAGLGEAKAAVRTNIVKVAVAEAAQKVKSGTSKGFKWVKDKYQKRHSSE